jgi:uncharacterized membrane protein YeiH
MTSILSAKKGIASVIYSLMLPIHVLYLISVVLSFALETGSAQLKIKLPERGAPDY